MGIMNSAGEKIDTVVRSPRFHLIAFGIIFVLVLIAYSNTFTASFHFDDNPSIVENYSIKQVTWENIVAILKGVRPVVYMSLMLNYQLSGLNVVGWHVFNISFHILNSYMVYLLFVRILTSTLLLDGYGHRARRMALFGALLFALHPIQTESVTYIITRTELLATFFYLATFLLFIKGTDTKKFFYYILAALSSLLAMGSKEWAVTLPAVLLLFDYLFLGSRSVKQVLSRWKAYVLILLTWIKIYFAVDLTATGASGIGFNIQSTTGLNPVTYLLTSMNVIWTYIRLMFLPINQNLDYDYAIAKTLFEFPTLLSFTGHLAIIGGASWLFWKKKALLIPFGVAWFYIGLSPVQSFVPIIDVIFEHRMYMPSIGFFIVFVAAYESIFEWWETKSRSAGIADAQSSAHT